jgi:hypothetical protein
MEVEQLQMGKKKNMMLELQEQQVFSTKNCKKNKYK